MVKVMVVDDVERDLHQLVSTVRQHFGEQNCSVKCFANGHEALEWLNGGNSADIAILDIIMPGMTGIELARHMRAAGWDGQILFLTLSNDFAAESYQVEAAGYVLKPATAENVGAALSRIELMKSKTDAASFMIRRKGNSLRVLYRELMYVEVRQHRLLFHLSGGAIEQTYGTMKDYTQLLLSEPRMSKPNQSYIVNMEYIRAFEARALVMWDGVRISVPRDFIEFQRRCVRWMFERE